MFKLIDMNGRVYDPIIGRFLSPDPIIQSPDFTQSYNGYSYCVNNPLKYFDASGFTYSNNDNESFGDPNHYTIAQMWEMVFGALWYELPKSLESGAAGRREKEKDEEKLQALNNRTEFRTVYLLINGVLVPVQVPVQEKTENKRQNELSVDFRGKITLGVQAGGNIGGLLGGYGLFINLWSLTIIGGDTKTKEVNYPGSQVHNFSQMNQDLSGGSAIHGGISHTFDGSLNGYGFENSQLSFTGSIGSKQATNGLNLNITHSSSEGNYVSVTFPIKVALIIGFDGCMTIRFRKRY